MITAYSYGQFQDDLLSDGSFGWQWRLLGEHESAGEAASNVAFYRQNAPPPGFPGTMGYGGYYAWEGRWVWHSG